MEEGFEVVGIDNLNEYYDPTLKKFRLAHLNPVPLFSFKQLDMTDLPALTELFETYHFDVIVNVAAQAGVRYSLQNPHAYVDSNIAGFVNLLEGCRHSGVKHLVFASSSSVYEGNTTMPFSVHDNVNHPVSLYATTKKSNELMAHAYKIKNSNSGDTLAIFEVCQVF